MAALPRKGEWWVLRRPLPSGDVLIWEFEIMERETTTKWRLKIQERMGRTGWMTDAWLYHKKGWLRKMRKSAEKKRPTKKEKPKKRVTKKKKKRRVKR